MLRIVIADDELPIREWLKYCLSEKEDRFQIVGRAADGQEAYELLLEKEPDVLITDIRMPKMSGLSLMKASRDRLPQLTFVVLTNHADFAYAKEAISCGAKEYILKSELRSSELIRILEEIEEDKNKARQADRPGLGPRMPQIMAEKMEEDHRGHEAVKEALAYMAQHYGDKLSLSELAQHVYRSPAYFSRLFKEVTGKNFSTYLTLYRLKQGQKLLRQTRLKITDIAAMVGYQNPSYFSRLYKKHMGWTPEEERRKQGERGQNK